MGMAWLDHVNIRTANLAAMSHFYQEVLGLPAGDRPDFRFPGAWHYCGGRAVVHLVGVAQAPAGTEPRVEHFALRAFGFSPFLDRLRQAGVAYSVALVPGYNLRQVNILDPDGNHIEVQFGPEEEGDMTAFSGGPQK